MKLRSFRLRKRNSDMASLVTPSEFTQQWSPPHSEVGVLLASASYEERSVSIVQALPDTYRYRVGLLYANEEFLALPATGEHLGRLRELMSRRCDKVCYETGSWLDPLKQLSALRQLVAAIGVPHAEGIMRYSVDVDVSTFTRESLIVGCALLRQQVKPENLRVFYSAPEDHGDWLSRGYRCVRNVMGFAGVQIPGARTVLVAMTGFEPERTLRIIDEHEPSCVYLGIGDPPTAPQFLKRNIEQHQLILARQDVREFKFAAADIMDCLGQLEAVVKPHLGNSNVVIAPMSTKLSTIAAMLLAERHPSIQVTYCVPGEYNTASYSSGVRGICMHSL